MARAGLGLCLSLAVIVSGCSHAPAAAPRPDVAETSERGPAATREAAEIAYSSGKFERAIELFTQLIQDAPDEPGNYLWRAQALQRLGRIDEAQRDLDAAVQRFPREPEPYLQRAQLRYARGRLPEAIADCSSALRIDGEHLAGAQSMRASMYLATGDYRRAIADCDEAIRRNPEFAQAYNNRGLAKQNLGDLDGAIEDFSAAIAHHGQLSEAFNNRGVLRMQRGETESALADLNEAIRLAPLSPTGYDNRSRLYLEQLDQPEQAARDCTRLIQVVEREAAQRQGSVAGRKTAAIYARRAMARWRMDQSDNALADCQAALSIDAGCAPAQQLLKEIAARNNR